MSLPIPQELFDDIASIRKLVDVAFSDEDLNTFCFDNFPSVFKEFTAGQPQGARVRSLVKYAEQQGLLKELLDDVRKANPYQYAQFIQKRLAALMAEAEQAEAQPDWPQAIRFYQRILEIAEHYKNSPSKVQVNEFAAQLKATQLTIDEYYNNASERLAEAERRRRLQSPPAGTNSIPLPVEKPPVPPSVPPQVKRRGFGFVVWWGLLSDGTKAAYIGVFGSLLVALIGLVGTLGAPVITEWAKSVFVRPTAIAMTTATFTPTAILTATSVPTLTPTPIATSTPTPTSAPILTSTSVLKVRIIITVLSPYTLKEQSFPIECGGIVLLPSSGIILIMADIPITSEQERELHWSALIGQTRPQEGRASSYYQNPRELKQDVVSLERKGVRICYFYIIVQQAP